MCAHTAGWDSIETNTAERNINEQRLTIRQIVHAYGMSCDLEFASDTVGSLGASFLANSQPSPSRMRIEPQESTASPGNISRSLDAAHRGTVTIQNLRVASTSSLFGSSESSDRLSELPWGPLVPVSYLLSVEIERALRHVPVALTA